MARFACADTTLDVGRMLSTLAARMLPLQVFPLAVSVSVGTFYH
jgi:hypothetical protein